MKLQEKLEEFSFYHSNGNTVYRYIISQNILGYLYSFHCIFSLQTGTIRTNCLDCLDRTNSVQTFLGLEVSGSDINLI